ncbi:MAG: adenylosuccinate synthase [Candidatus Marinimicrobia bacterium]|nr:adenylosuccinate synthase [Candidatus Neomarinimicrobiota bacterium]MBL7023174.1 adenylosuccinate synthase [Candidatus Neomarinimicrobiota bacterium]MBL7109018.1 adenylosuccinate synthase [Candidatus Neomarinimicrobiota bacterium]
MAITSVIGGQWGDEGKGKIVDFLSENVGIVARYQGGANAGHTVYIGEQKIVLHQIPSGILRQDCITIMGNGMVLDPVGLVDEMNMLNNLNIETKNRIHIALNTSIVTPIHKAIDRASETATNNRIGTTCKGIGPTYVDKYNRVGIRAFDLLNIKSLKEKITARLKVAENNNELIGISISSIKLELEEFYKAVTQIAPYVKDTFTLLHEQIKNGVNVLVEGAQGTLLDIDHGTYPFVTSSNPTSGGITTGLGLPISKIDRNIGIIKAYTTRVGKGPFPTELFDDDGKQLSNIGNEFGATTGRPRRCGWFDGIAAKYSCQINGFTEVALTKLDILDTFEEIKVCVEYEINGKTTKSLPSVMHRLDEVKPIYETIPGWNKPTCEVEHFNELPLRAKEYIGYLSDLMETPIKIISIGPERNQIISR